MPKLAANLSMMFDEMDFLKRFQAAAVAGFSGVEYLFPYQYEKQQLVENLRINGLIQVLHNLPAGNWDEGERGIACHPDRIGEFQDGVGIGVEYAEELGCKQLNCLAGIEQDGVDPERARETFVSNLKFAARELQSSGITLLIESINTRDIPGFYLCNTSQAKSIIEEVSDSNLKFQYDVYHMQIMEGDLVPTIKSNLDIIRHIQIADTPGRNEPGTGEINYSFVLDTIDEIGYEGWIGCEYKPLTTTSAGLEWASRYIPS